MLFFGDGEVLDDRLQPLGYGLWDSLGLNTREKNRVMNGRAAQVLLTHNVANGTTVRFRAELKKMNLRIPDSWVHNAWIALLFAGVAELGLIRESLIKYRQHLKNQIGATAANRWRDFSEQWTMDDGIS